jgi:hypothetical protein
MLNLLKVKHERKINIEVILKLNKKETPVTGLQAVGAESGRKMRDTD